MKIEKKIYGLKEGLDYAIIHFLLEIICFYYLINVYNNTSLAWITALIYDVLAFGLQPVIGILYDHFHKFNIGIPGIILTGVSAYIGLLFPTLSFPCLIILGIGNSMVHISGAVTTIHASKGQLSSVAIFVAGGAAGVFVGKNFSTNHFPVIIIIILCIVLSIMFFSDKKMIKLEKRTIDFSTYDYVKYNNLLTVFLLFIIVMTRSYISLGIPMSWNQSVFTKGILCLALVIGKALGGILTDLFGIKRIAVASTLISIPFLLLGSDTMWISLIGIALYAMTMSVTLAGILSVLNQFIGLAFGITTLGLLCGSIPVFLGIKSSTIMLVPACIFSAIVFSVILKSSKCAIQKHEGYYITHINYYKGE